MVPINRAVSEATHQLQVLFGEVSSVRLEEVFQSDDGSAWCVTLSFLVPVAQEEAEPGAGTPLLNLKRRDYKTFEIDGQSGQFRAMKIRSVPSV